MSEPKGPQQIALEKPFPAEVISEVQGFDYIPVGYVIDRMNNVLGTGGWSSQVVKAEMVNNEIVAHVTVTANIDGRNCARDGFGGAQKNPRGMGDTYKSATSDALKKACQALGVGLHLAIDEILEPEIDAEDYEKVNTFVRGLTDDQRAEIGAWWKEYGTPQYDFYSIDAETWEEYKAYVRTFHNTETAEQPTQETMEAEDVAAALDGEVVNA